jgi:hypothetical protein
MMYVVEIMFPSPRFICDPDNGGRGLLTKLNSHLPEFKNQTHACVEASKPIM